ncbi:MAG: hypothetical protein QG632_794 [Candidatus Dependentiae bacterium]|nr:hypothetical protein [Candidatus Dependentiae bacterium]
MINRLVLAAAFFIIFGGTLEAADGAAVKAEQWRLLENKMRSKKVGEQSPLISAIGIANTIYCKLNTPIIYIRVSFESLKATLLNNMSDIVLAVERRPLVERSELLFWQDLHLTAKDLCSGLPQDVPIKEDVHVL